MEIYCTYMVAGTAANRYSAKELFWKILKNIYRIIAALLFFFNRVLGGEF